MPSMWPPVSSRPRLPARSSPVSGRSRRLEVLSSSVSPRRSRRRESPEASPAGGSSARCRSCARAAWAACAGRSSAANGSSSACRSTYRELGDEPRLVTIIGDPGVGKTRLVREAWEWLAGESPEPLRRTGRCLSYGQGITYWPLAEVLKEHLGILESDAPASVLSRLEGREILGLTLGLDVAGGLHPLDGPRPSARGLGRARDRARRGATCCRPRGGPALGRAGAARPARATRPGREGPSAAHRHRASGAARRPARLGWRAACSRDPRARAALARRQPADARHALGRRAAGRPNETSSSSARRGTRSSSRSCWGP